METPTTYQAEIDSYAYLWEGEGWGLHESHGRTVHLVVHFARAEGPTVRELLLLRQWRPEFQHLLPAEVKQIAGKRGNYVVGNFWGRKGELLRDSGRALSLEIAATTRHITRGILMRLAEPISMLAIDDYWLSADIYHYMKAAGRPIISIKEED